MNGNCANLHVISGQQILAWNFSSFDFAVTQIQETLFYFLPEHTDLRGRPSSAPLSPNSEGLYSVWLGSPSPGWGEYAEGKERHFSMKQATSPSKNAFHHFSGISMAVCKTGEGRGREEKGGTGWDKNLQKACAYGPRRVLICSMHAYLRVSPLNFLGTNMIMKDFIYCIKLKYHLLQQDHAINWLHFENGCNNNQRPDFESIYRTTKFMCRYIK